jgi:hypothetical protein
MKGHLAVIAALTMGTVSVARAEKPRATYRWTDPSRIGADWAQPTPANVDHIIYLNRCVGGCTLHPGNNNSTTDTSSIVNSTAHLSQYSGTTSQWNQIVQCVKQTYAPFNVQIVTDRPPQGTNYHMAIVAGYASEAGEQNGVLGVSPFSCGYIRNSISFSFANEEPSNIDDICWTVSQETAHSWGLDHKYDNRDPMTYLTSGPSMKTFQNQAGSCGEYNARQCSCTYQGTGSSAMNSYALIMATFGANAPDTTNPTVSITDPASGSIVDPGFPVHVDANDDVALDHVELKIDGQSIGSKTDAPFFWNAPANLPGTSHHIEVTAYDVAGNTATDTADVSFAVGCQQNTDCDDGMLCSNGQCVPGPDTQGGLGADCTGNDDCASGMCADDGQGHQYCVNSCDPNASTCPSNFTCVDVGGGAGVCWPGGGGGGNNNGDGSSGGCNAGGSSSAPLLLGLGLGAMLITRRRRR